VVRRAVIVAAVVIMGVVLRVAGVPAGATGAIRRPPAPITSAVVLTQRDATGTSLLTLTAGSAKVMFTPDGYASPTFGTILQYAAGRAIAFDPARREYVDLSIAQAEQRVQQLREQALTPRTLPSGVPSFPSALPPAKLSQTAAHVSVGGLGGVTSQLSTDATTMRVTYATAIPEPPAPMIKELGAAALDRDPFDSALGARLGQVPLEVQVRVGNAWQTELSTVSVRHESVAPSALAVPDGYAEVSARQLFGVLSGGGPAAIVYPQDPDYPVVAFPRVAGLDWFKNGKSDVCTPGPTAGTAAPDGTCHDLAVYLDNQATGEAIKKAYGGDLSQYGVVGLPGVHTRSHPVGGVAPKIVGDDSPIGVADVYAMLWEQMLEGKTPGYWTCCGADPIIFVFVRKEDVDSSSVWDSYHFWVPTLGALVPWPLSLWLQPGVPYTLVKAFADSNTNPKDGVDATDALSHEYVEAATDPFFPFGWLDPGREPIWTEGEIGDICGNDPSNPVTINGFATYWSNLQHRCVP
jgi:hypothetical protein